MAITPFAAHNAAYPTYYFMPEPPTIQSPESFLGSKKITPLKVEERTSRGTVASLLNEWSNREAFCALSIAGSVATHNPLPLIWGFSDCLKSARAIPVVNNSIPDYATDFMNVNYQFANDTFYDTEGDALVYSTALVDGSPLPAEVKFDPSTRTFSGSTSKAMSVRVFAKNSHNEEVYTDFGISLGTPAIILTFSFFGGLSLCLCIASTRYCYKLSSNATTVPNYGTVTLPSHAMLINEADEEALIALFPSNVNAICSICHEIMSDPVILPDSKRIDRSCIQHYYNIGGRFCPETRVPLPDPTTLPTDAVLKKIVENFKKSKR